MFSFFFFFFLNVGKGGHSNIVFVFVSPNATSAKFCQFFFFFGGGHTLQLYFTVRSDNVLKKNLKIRFLVDFSFPEL